MNPVKKLKSKTLSSLVWSKDLPETINSGSIGLQIGVSLKIVGDFFFMSDHKRVKMFELATGS